MGQALGADAAVVEQIVNATEALYRFADGSGDGRIIKHIGLEREALAAGGLALGARADDAVRLGRDSLGKAVHEPIAQKRLHRVTQ